MKKFLIKLSLVLVPFILVALVVVRVSYTTELQILKRDLTFPTNIVGAVVGDSRVEVYFDPEEIPWLKNCGQAATPFQISAHKAKIIVEQNPHLKMMIVDFWPDKMFGENVPFEPSAPCGVSLIELQTRENMPPIDDEFIVRLSRGVIRPDLMHSLGRTGKSQIAGGFMKNYNFLSKTKWAKKETYTKHGMYQLKKTTLYMESVLEELIVWLKDHHITVVLTSTPLWHMWWENYYSHDARDYFEHRMREIAQKHGVTWFNWLHDYQDHIDYWADGNHLNDIGAKVFSHDKRKLLEGLLPK